MIAAKAKYIGPERRRKGLVECDTCHRRLRPDQFKATRDYDRLAVSALEPSCIDCVASLKEQRAAEIQAVRDEQRAAERAMYPPATAPEPVERVIERVIERHSGQVEHVKKTFETRDDGAGKTILVGVEEERWWTDEGSTSTIGASGSRSPRRPRSFRGGTR